MLRRKFSFTQILKNVFVCFFCLFVCLLIVYIVSRINRPYLYLEQLNSLPNKSAFNSFNDTCQLHVNLVFGVHVSL